MRNIVFVLFAIFVSGCAANGSRFQGVEAYDGNSSTVYLFRQSAFYGCGYCPVIQLNGADIGCLENGGYMRIKVDPGSNTLKIRKRLLEAGPEPEVSFIVNSGDIKFYEWSIMLTGEAINEYKREDALKILENLNSQ